MKKDYVTTRKEVCVGRLVEDDSLICRGMLFDINQDGLTHDLIYTTPTCYPIKGVYNKINKESSFIIDQYVELEELLKYLKYSVELTQIDLNHIYRKLIENSSWIESHMGLFGCEKETKKAYLCQDELLPTKIYEILRRTNYLKSGKPYVDEPNYSYIKRRK